MYLNFQSIPWAHTIHLDIQCFLDERFFRPEYQCSNDKFIPLLVVLLSSDLKLMKSIVYLFYLNVKAFKIHLSHHLGFNFREKILAP